MALWDPWSVCGGVCGASWSIAERCCLVLGISWVVLGSSDGFLAFLGAFWCVSWWVLEPLGFNLDRFGGTSAVENHGKTQGKTRFSRTFAFLPFMCLKNRFCGLLDRFGIYLGHRGALLRGIGGLLRLFWGAFGLPWGLLERLFWNVCGPYGASWSTLGRLGAPRAPLLEVLDGFWTFLST